MLTTTTLPPDPTAKILSSPQGRWWRGIFSLLSWRPRPLEELEEATTGHRGMGTSEVGEAGSGALVGSGGRGGRAEL